MLRAALIGGCLACLSWSASLAADTRSVATLPPQSGGYFKVGVVSYRDMLFRTVVRQQYDFSCGSASLATLLRYHYGYDVDEPTVFKTMFVGGDKAEIQRRGFSLADIQRYLTSIGYKSDGYRIPFERYAKAGVPAIALVRIGQYKHFVVIKGYENGRVLVGDPATGLHAYRLAEFEKIWDGLIFIIHDEAHPNDHHNFDDPVEWSMLRESPFVGPSDIYASATRSTVLDYSTIFAVRLPSPANN